MNDGEHLSASPPQKPPTPPPPPPPPPAEKRHLIIKAPTVTTAAAPVVPLPSFCAGTSDAAAATAAELSAGRTGSSVCPPEAGEGADLPRETAGALLSSQVDDGDDNDDESDWCHSLVRRHYQRLGYRVHSGLQFGSDFVLYRDDPSRVHSSFCVRVIPPGGTVDWRSAQILARSMPALHKSLVLAAVVGTTPTAATAADPEEEAEQAEALAEAEVDQQTRPAVPAAGEEPAATHNFHGCLENRTGTFDSSNFSNMKHYRVREVLVTSEHAPFRQKCLQRRKGKAGLDLAAEASVKPKPKPTKKVRAKSSASPARAG